MKVLLVPSANPKTLAAARLLAARLLVAGIEAAVQPPDVCDRPVVDADELALVVPMGGDGTFLAAVRLIDFSSVPLLAFNYGSLGFLSGNPERDEVELIADALCGDVAFQRRSTLAASIVEADGTTTEVTALNELVYARGTSGRVVKFAYGINGREIARLKADGLIVSTSTGSTGYALSAGGPIVSPAYTGLVVVPLAPHAIGTRAIVTAPSDVVDIDIEDAGPDETTVFVDGRAVAVREPVGIQVRRSAHEVLLAQGGGDFYTSVSRVFFGGQPDGAAER